MSNEELLKNCILEQYKSVREFCLANDFPYSTIDNIFRRGLMKSSVSIVIRVCDRLGIEVDELVNGKIVKKIVAADDRVDISALYARLDSIDRAKAEAFISGLLSSDKYSGGANIPQDVENTVRAFSAIPTATKQK